MIAQVFESLPPLEKNTRTEFPAPGFALAQSWLVQASGGESVDESSVLFSFIFLSAPPIRQINI